MKPPHSCELKQRLTFQRMGAETNVGGVASSDYEDMEGLCAISAKIMPTRGGEDVIAGRLSGQVQYDIWIRYSRAAATITNRDRAVNYRTGEIYNIGQPIDPFQNSQWLLIQAQSVGRNV